MNIFHVNELDLWWSTFNKNNNMANFPGIQALSELKVVLGSSVCELHWVSESGQELKPQNVTEVPFFSYTPKN